MMPLRNALPHGAFEVPTEPGPDGFVNLQYLDDGYGDNGYWGRDDGWWEQCFRAPDAFVVITIQHGCVPTRSRVTRACGGFLWTSPRAKSMTTDSL